MFHPGPDSLARCPSWPQEYQRGRGGGIGTRLSVCLVQQVGVRAVGVLTALPLVSLPLVALELVCVTLSDRIMLPITQWFSSKAINVSTLGAPCWASWRRLAVPGGTGQSQLGPLLVALQLLPACSWYNGPVMVPGPGLEPQVHSSSHAHAGPEQEG